MAEDRNERDAAPTREHRGPPGDVEWHTMSDEESRQLRARQRSRNRALAIVLWALVILFFAISIVKFRIKGQL